jgi:hypothetical protein
MPWQSAAAISDDDLKAVFAYLQNVPPIRNSVPNTVLSPAPGSPGGSR